MTKTFTDLALFIKAMFRKATGWFIEKNQITIVEQKIKEVQRKLTEVKGNAVNREAERRTYVDALDGLKVQAKEAVGYLTKAQSKGDEESLAVIPQIKAHMSKINIQIKTTEAKIAMLSQVVNDYNTELHSLSAVVQKWDTKLCQIKAHEDVINLRKDLGQHVEDGDGILDVEALDRELQEITDRQTKDNHTFDVVKEKKASNFTNPMLAAGLGDDDDDLEAEIKSMIETYGEPTESTEYVTVNLNDPLLHTTNATEAPEPAVKAVDNVANL